MRLREPKLQPPVQLNFEKATCQGSTFRVTTLTPIYGGGVIAGEPDKELPVRAAAIRGQLRFWWRLLEADSKTLFADEREIWGAMGEEGKDYASKVKIRVTNVQNCQIKHFARPEQLQIPPYAIGVLMSGHDQLAVIAPGMSFDLRIEYVGHSVSDDIRDQVQQTLRWWVSFGGLGARTRRGFGAVRVEGLEPVKPDEVISKGCRLVLKPLANSAMSAWDQAIQPLNKFRQGENLGRNPKSAGSRVPGRSRWPEADSIREIVDQRRKKADGTEFNPAHPARRAFPRAMFGMPINFHFKNIKRDRPPERRDSAFDPDDVVLQPLDSERLASPLILKPVAQDNDKYAPGALLLPSNHLLKVDLVLKMRKKNVSTLEAGQWWPSIESTAAQAKANQIKPLENRNSNGNPLLAFLDYFEKGR